MPSASDARSIELSEQDYAFLLTFVKRLARRTTAQPNIGFQERFKSLERSLTKGQKPVATPEPSVVIEASSKTKSAKPTVVHTSCADHPNYTGQRRPRSGCPICLKVYEHRQNR